MRRTHNNVLHRQVELVANCFGVLATTACSLRFLAPQPIRTRGPATLIAILSGFMLIFGCNAYEDVNEPWVGKRGLSQPPFSPNAA